MFFLQSSNSYVLVTGLTQAITAASTSNKILINVTLYGGVSSIIMLLALN